jgi:hypothetical protein
MMHQKCGSHAPPTQLILPLSAGTGGSSGVVSRGNQQPGGLNNTLHKDANRWVASDATSCFLEGGSVQICYEEYLNYSRPVAVVKVDALFGPVRVKRLDWSVSPAKRGLRDPVDRLWPCRMCALSWMPKNAPLGERLPRHDWITRHERAWLCKSAR